MTIRELDEMLEENGGCIEFGPEEPWISDYGRDYRLMSKDDEFIRKLTAEEAIRMIEETF